MFLNVKNVSLSSWDTLYCKMFASILIWANQNGVKVVLILYGWHQLHSWSANVVWYYLWMLQQPAKAAPGVKLSAGGAQPKAAGSSCCSWTRKIRYSSVKDCVWTWSWVAESTEILFSAHSTVQAMLLGTIRRSMREKFGLRTTSGGCDRTVGVTHGLLLSFNRCAYCISLLL